MKSISHTPAKVVRGAALLAAFLIAPWAIHAAPSADDAAKPAEARPLPKFYDQLGLTDEQKEKIFKTEDKFKPLVESQIEMAKAVAQGGTLVDKVSALRVLNALRANQKKAIRSILTEDQLDKLKELMGEKTPPKSADAPPKP
jgi:hypothetical protein